MSSKVISLGDFTAVSTGATVNLTAETDQGLDGCVFVYGTFVATIIVEVSPDGTNWQQAKTDNNANLSATAAGAFPLRTGAPFVRARCSAFTSGTASVRFVPRS